MTAPSTPPIERESQSVEDTMTIAGEVARVLKGGECIALHGDLGAGKTQFVRGLVIALGGEARSVSSPTYVLLHVYDSGRLKVFHLDAYRVHSGEDFDGIGFSELLEQNGVVIVEWPSRVASQLPDKTIHIHIQSTGESARRITIMNLQLAA